MSMKSRYLPVVSAALVASIALAGCGSKETKTESAPSAATVTSTVTVTPSAAQPAGAKVAAADLPAIVSNRTFRGVSKGKAYSEYYVADGTLRGKWTGADSYTGTWKVTDEQLCFTYTYDPGNVSCYAVFKDGEVVTWLDSQGQIVEAAYVDGNPDKL